jgi:hypothetical protein
MNQQPEKALFEDVAQLRQLSPAFVEKDWFVTAAIGAIADIHVAGFSVVFTGGTALSKAHGLLERFSEDVDFRVQIAETQRNRKARSRFKTAVVHALRKSGFVFNDGEVRAQDENRYFSIDLAYESVFTKADALRPHIQIEISARDPQMTPLVRPVASFVSAASNQPPEVSAIRCIDPVESAADKLSAIAWRIPDRIRGGQYDDPSLVRHIHDLALLKDMALAHEQFTSLVMAAMQDDATRPKNNPALANMPAPEKLALMLNILTEDKSYPLEYERFVGGVSYAALERIPQYSDAVEAIRQLVKAVSVTTLY